MFRAYNRGGGNGGDRDDDRRDDDRSDNRNNRYNRNYQPPLPTGAGSSGRNNRNRSNYPHERFIPRFARTEPPAVLPEVSQQFSTNHAQMSRTFELRQYEEREREIRRLAEEAIRREQDKTIYGLKQIGPDEYDSEDDDIVPMGSGSVHSALNPPIQQIIIVKEPKKKKKKKHKKKDRKRSRSSSSSSETNYSSSPRKKKSRHDNIEGNSQDEGTSQQSSSRSQEQISLFHARNNPWKMLRKNEYIYLAAHMVVDSRPDRENLQYEQPYKHEVSDYYSVYKPTDAAKDLCAISQQWKKMISKPEQYLLNNEDRWHAERHMKNWYLAAVERIFRRIEENRLFIDYTELSYQPCEENEEKAILKREVDGQLLNRMDINDYAHHIESQKVSYEESRSFNLNGQHSHLHKRTNENRNDIQAWLEFIDIQRPLQAKLESGDQNAPIQNERALYDRNMEILRKAIGFNQSSVELYIKKLQLMEAFPLLITTQDIRSEWQRCENKFVNECKMWEENLKMQLNDRSKFELEPMLKSIDRCIEKLVRIKYGIIRSHPLKVGTEEFLVKVLVMRCRLLIATGYIDRAIAMMQALAEFHFFRSEFLDDPKTDTKPKTNWEVALNQFRRFWESGAHRIGYDNMGAEGWCNVDYNDVDKQQEMETESDILEGHKTETKKMEDKEVVDYKKKSLSLIEARRKLDKLRTRFYWMPIQFKHEDETLYEYESRIVPFEQVKPVLFFFDDNNLAQELIFQLLHTFGVTVQGLHCTSQEDILRAFSHEIFPSFRPVTLKLEGFPEFIKEFVCLLAVSPHMEQRRIYTALVTNISNTSLSKADKYVQLRALARDISKMHDRAGTPLITDVQLAVFAYIFEEMVKLKPITEDYFPIEVCLVLLKMNLDQKNESLWNLKAKIHESPQMHLLYLFMLRFAVFLARNLPFSDAKEALLSSAKESKIKAQIDKFDNKADFLLSIWATGKVARVEPNEQTIAAAQDRFMEILKTTPEKDLMNWQYRWIGNKDELLFELAALFAYEFPPRQPTNRYKFFQEDRPLFSRNELANSLKDSQTVAELRVHVLQHITHSTMEYTPANLMRMIEIQVERFPHSIPLLKTMLDVSRRHKQQIFLSKNPGNDALTRLIRDCGRIYTERVRLDVELTQRSGWAEKEMKTIFKRLIGIFRKVAEANSANFIPDDYIWRFFMRIIVDARTQIPPQTVDEIFVLGQAVCPWSKDFIYEAARGRPSTENSFLTTLQSSMRAHQLREYCSDGEVQLLMTHTLG